MYNPMVTFIHHEKLWMVLQSCTENVCLSRESKCQKYFIFRKTAQILWHIQKYTGQKGSKLNNAYHGNEIW